MTKSAAATAPQGSALDARRMEGEFDLSTVFRISRVIKHQLEHEVRGESGAETQARVILLARAQTRLIDLAGKMTGRDARSIRLELDAWLSTPANAADSLEHMNDHDMAAIEAALKLVEKFPAQREMTTTE